MCLPRTFCPGGGGTQWSSGSGAHRASAQEARPLTQPDLREKVVEQAGQEGKPVKGIPLVLSFMIWSTARMGANQSATGLLYVGVVFVIIGEIISKYMFVMSGIPI